MDDSRTHCVGARKLHIYVNTDKAVLCFDRAGQYYMVDEAEIALCKTVNKGSHVCKQKHPLLSTF